jgi:hypothetical protein
MACSTLARIGLGIGAGKVSSQEKGQIYHQRQADEASGFSVKQLCIHNGF